MATIALDNPLRKRLMGANSTARWSISFIKPSISQTVPLNDRREFLSLRALCRTHALARIRRQAFASDAVDGPGEIRALRRAHWQMRVGIFHLLFRKEQNLYEMGD